jgi:hypothetical protein
MQTRGGTDGTLIGNVSDRLKVQNLSIGGPITTSSKFTVEYNNGNTAVTGAAYTTFYSYSGSGLFWGFRVNTDQDGGQIQLTIDGNIIFTGITSKNISDSGGASVNFEYLSRAGAGSFYFFAPYPIDYTTSVVLAAKRDNNGNLSVQQRIIYITKET